MPAGSFRIERNWNQDVPVVYVNVSPFSIGDNVNVWHPLVICSHPGDHVDQGRLLQSCCVQVNFEAAFNYLPNCESQ